LKTVDTNTSNPQAKLVLFACQHCLEEESGPLQQTAKDSGFALQLVSLPCSSALEPAIVLRAFENGADAVEVLACRFEDCHLGNGSRRASKRIARAKQTIEDSGLGGARLVFQHREPGRGATDAIADLIAAARSAGPSPLRKKP